MIDIIIATYQRQDLLPFTLQGVQGQTFKDWRCWISEDGSDPKTRTCIKPFLADKRFLYLGGEHYGYPAGPRNRAILKGDSEYVAILDDDDIWLPEKLQKQVNFLQEHPECVMVGTNAYRWDGESMDAGILTLYHEKIPHGKIDFKLLLEGNCFIASSVVMRRAALDQSGFFNEKLNPPVGEDLELWYRLAAVGELWFMGEPLLLYRDLPPKYYNRLKGAALTAWKAGLLEAALEGSHAPSPFLRPENAAMKNLLQEKIAYLRARPHFWGKTGNRLKKLLGAVAGTIRK